MSDRDYDLLDLATHSNNPEPMLNWLREESPIYYDKHNELWAVSRYEDIIAISSDQETYTSTRKRIAESAF